MEQGWSRAFTGILSEKAIRSSLKVAEAKGQTAYAEALRRELTARGLPEVDPKPHCQHGRQATGECEDCISLHPRVERFARSGRII